MTQLLIAPEPFTQRVESFEVIEGLSIRELLAQACSAGALDLRDVTRTRVYIDGKQIVLKDSLRLVPPAGSLINMAVDPEGGNGSDTNKALQVVLTVAIIALSVWTGGATGPLAGSTALVRASAAAAIQVGGALAVNLLFAPNTEELAKANDRYALQGASNQFRPRSPMPLIMGKQRVGFDLAAKPYSQLVGDDSWYHVILGLHYGPCTLTDVKIGETLLTEYPAEDVEVEYFLEPGPRNSFLYPGRVVQEDLTDLLDKNGAYEVHTSAEDADQLEVDLSWPNGLRFNKDNGKTLPQEVQGVVEWKLVGTSTWGPAPIQTYYDRLGHAVPAGNFYFQGRTNDPMRRTISWMTGVKGQYDVRIRVWDPDADDPERTVDKTYWTALRVKENKPPIIDETLSIMILRIKASNDLNGTFPTVTGVVEPICPIWNGSDWNTVQATSNAAALARWLLTGPAAAIPADVAEIHQSCADAYDLIEEYDWKGSLELRDEMSQEDALLALGRLGRFLTYHTGSELVFVPDWEKPVPRQLFAGRNAQGYRYRRLYTGEIHAVFIEFKNLDENSATDELWVYNDGYDKESATLFETVRIDFACTANRAYREGRVYLAKRVLQVESHEWTSSIDSVVCTLGDRVRVSHPSTEFGLGSGRVLFRHMTGSLVSAIRLDEEFELVDGESYEIDVRRSDQVLFQVPVQTIPGRARDLTFATPIPVADAPRKGDLVVLGKVNVVTEDVEIIDIQPQGDFATMRARLYAAEGIQAAETGLIPPLQTSIKPLQKSPTPVIIFTNPLPSGVEVTYTVPPSVGSQVEGFVLRWRYTPSGFEVSAWNTMPVYPSSARTVKTGPIPDSQFADNEGQVHVDVELSTLLRSGESSLPAKRYNILVTQNVLTPSTFFAEGVVRLSPDGSSRAVLHVAATLQVAGSIQWLEVELKYTTENASSYRSAGSPLPAANPESDFVNVEGGRHYDVRGRWKTVEGWYSDWVYVLDVAIPADGNVANPPFNLLAQIEAAIAQITGILDEAGLNAELIIKNALLNKSRDDVLKKLGFTPNGLPMGQFVVEQKTRTDLLREDVNLVGVRNEDGTAFYLDLLTLKIDPDTGESFADRLSSINTSFGNVSSSIFNEQVARASATSALATQITTLNSVVGSNYAVIDERLTTQVGSINSLAAAVSTLSSNFNGNVSSVQQSLITLSNAQQAFSSSLTTLSSTVGGLSSSVQVYGQAISTLQGNAEAQWGVRVNAGHRATGFRIEATGQETAFDVEADYFRVWNGVTSVPAFEVSGNQAYVAGSRVRTESMVSNAVSDTSASTGDYGGSYSNSGGGAQVCSISITGTGRPVLITAMYRGRQTTGPGNINATADLRRNGTIVQTAGAYCLKGYDVSQTFMHSEVIPNGVTYTYDVYDTVGIGANMVFYNYGISAVNLKV